MSELLKISEALVELLMDTFSSPLERLGLAVFACGQIVLTIMAYRALKASR
jgi:hypothetical protein